MADISQIIHHPRSLIRLLPLSPLAKCAQPIQITFPEAPAVAKIPRFPEGDGGSHNEIFGCFIGTDKTGTIANGNGAGINSKGIVETAGIVTDTDMHIIGGPTMEERNVISGNHGHGLILGGRGHLVRGNLIGVAANGTQLGNDFDGINIAGGQFSNGIGVIGASQSPMDGNCQMEIDNSGVVLNERNEYGNRIAFNGRYGIIVGFNDYEILSNTIYSNGDLGIDVDTLSVTPNDPTGSNRNYPDWILPWEKFFNLNPPTQVTRVSGSITNRSNGPSIIQVFHNSNCDRSGNGEGQELIRTFIVPGNKTFKIFIPITAGFITATSTPRVIWGSRATSKFSVCQKI